MADANSAAFLHFEPRRNRGLALHISALLLIFVLVALLLTVAFSQPAGVIAVVLSILALLLSLLLPLLFYRLYSLIKSGYWVSRDGLRLRWGLRQIDLPHEAILDVARATDVENMVTPPRWNWPGAVVGVVNNAEFGDVEFMAADKQDLVLLGTKSRVYAISPQDAKEFVAGFKREALRGALRSLRPKSISASFVFVEAWADQLGRRLLLAGAILSIILLLFVGLLAPSLPKVSLGFGAYGAPLPSVAAVQLFLLPVLNLLFYMANLLLGLLFYREPNGANFSYLLWGCSLFASLLFLGAILFSI